MDKKRKQTTMTDWAEIPDTMGEDWVAGPPQEYDCELALYKAPNEVLVFAYTARGKEIIDQLCSGHEWIELDAHDGGNGVTNGMLGKENPNESPDGRKGKHARNDASRNDRSYSA